MKNKKGFTLIELLAVIILLATVFLIVALAFFRVIDSAKRNTFESDVRMLMRTLEYRMTVEKDFDYEELSVYNMEEKLGVKINNYDAVDFHTIDDKMYAVIVGSGQWSEYVACGDYLNVKAYKLDEEQDCLGYDTTGPSVHMAYEDYHLYKQNHSLNIAVSDISGVDSENLMYLWSLEEENVTFEMFSETFESHQQINAPSFLNGEYYLWIYAEDLVGNFTLIRSEESFKFDNIAPEIELAGPTSVLLAVNGTYYENGITATDNVDGDVSDNYEVIGNINVTIPGIYNLTYVAIDESNNISSQVQRTVEVKEFSLAFADVENKILNANEQYFIASPSSRPGTIGQTTEVTVNFLKTNNYLTNYTDPKNNEIDCNGYILTTLVAPGNFEKVPHVKCGVDNHISSKADDQLLTHFTFNAFQEPTTNLLLNPSFSGTENWSISSSGTGTLTASGNWGRINVPDGQVNRYHYVSQNIYDTFPENQPITFSVDFKNDIVGSFALRLVLFDGAVAATQPHVNVILDGTGGVRRFSVTASHPAITTRIRADILSGSYYTVYGGLSDSSVEFTNAQIEEKEYDTPFTPGIRTGTTHDLSGNTNHATLDPIKTPRWTTHSETGNGSYYFNGINSSIAFSGEELYQGDDFTLSTWVKRTGVGNVLDYLSIINNTDDSTYSFSFFLSLAENDMSGWLRHQDTTNFPLNPSNFTVNADEWYHLAYTVNHSEGKIKLYGNGELKLTIDFTGSFFNPVSRYTIGQFADRNGRYTFEGYIDNIAMYRRALSTDEIETIYLKE